MNRKAQAYSHLEHGQALVETAVFSVLLILIAFGLLSWVPVYRARSVANTAAYACAQFVSQSPDPGRAVWMGYQAARETLNSDWSGSFGIAYDVAVRPPGEPGEPGECRVAYYAPAWFHGLLGTHGEISEVTYVSRGERWKADWR